VEVNVASHVALGFDILCDSLRLRLGEEGGSCEEGTDQLLTPSAHSRLQLGCSTMVDVAAGIATGASSVPFVAPVTVKVDTIASKPAILVESADEIVAFGVSFEPQW